MRYGAAKVVTCPVDSRWNNDLVKKLRNDSTTESILYRQAAAAVPAVAAATPKDTGAAASSTRAEGGHRSADGRSVAAWLMQGGAGAPASVPQQFGNSRENTPARQFHRGLKL